jgi:hypothetical protein
MAAELWGSNGAGNGEPRLSSGPKREALGASSDNGMRAGLAVCRGRDTASARRVADRFGSKVLRWLGRGKRSVAGIEGVSGRHEVS